MVRADGGEGVGCVVGIVDRKENMRLVRHVRYHTFEQVTVD